MLLPEIFPQFSPYFKFVLTLLLGIKSFGIFLILGSLPHNPAPLLFQTRGKKRRSSTSSQFPPSFFLSFLSGSRGLRIVPFIFQSSRNTASLSLFLSGLCSIRAVGFGVFAPKTSEFEVKAAENDQIPSFRFPKIVICDFDLFYVLKHCPLLYRNSLTEELGCLTSSYFHSKLRLNKVKVVSFTSSKYRRDIFIRILFYKLQPLPRNNTPSNVVSSGS